MTTKQKYRVSSTCALSSSLPKWSGSKKVTWQDALGGGCFASPVKASVAEIKNYSTLLSDSNWTSSDGWSTTASVSTATYKKMKNVDTAYQLIMTGTSADSLYAFALNTTKITYKYLIQRNINILPIPKINSTPSITWSFINDYIAESNEVSMKPSDLNTFKSNLLANKWTTFAATTTSNGGYRIVYVDTTTPTYKKATYSLYIDSSNTKDGIYMFSVTMQ